MYQRNGIYWYRVWTPLGASRRVSLETKHEPTARAAAAWADDVRNRLDRHGVLAAVVRGELTLPQAFVLGETQAAQLLHAMAAEAADLEVTDTDLTAWTTWAQGRGVSERGVADYRRQVETVWHVTPRVQSWLQPRTILQALESLPCKEQTKGRYRAALSSLCEWLVRQGRMDLNPMGSVPGFAQGAPRSLWYSNEDALRLLHALPQPQRAAEAVMWACGWEWAAVERATVADFDLAKGTAFARGTKTATRQRLTAITRPEVIPWLEEALRHKLPAARVWAGLRNDTALKLHQRTCRELGIEVSTLHDWRHSFATRELRAGRSLQFVSQMLGHANTLLVQKVYGKYVLTEAEVRGHSAQPRHTGTDG
jgi:integrase